MAFVCHVKYRSVTEIVTCILLTSNQMIFLVQFGINKHSQIFQRLQIALALRARAISCSLRKICSCLFIPNCPRNHLITYTNSLFDAGFYCHIFTNIHHRQYTTDTTVTKQTTVYLLLITIYILHTTNLPWRLHCTYRKTCTNLFFALLWPFF